jgi:preprotein translocase subunit SecG
MQDGLLTVQIILAVIITAFVLLQSQGSGLGSTWGGGGETYHTRRGVEKVIFTLTIVAVILFALVSIAVIA